MASFNLAKVIFLFFLIYNKTVYSDDETSTLTSPDTSAMTTGDGTPPTDVSSDLTGVSVSIEEDEENPSSQEVTPPTSGGDDNSSAPLSTPDTSEPSGGTGHLRTGSSKGITLNVMDRKEGSGYECFARRMAYTYTPRGHELFSRVTVEVGNGALMLLDARNRSEMAFRVYYDDSNRKIKVVRVYCANGYVRTFIKTAAVDWSECEREKYWRELDAPPSQDNVKSPNDSQSADSAEHSKPQDTEEQSTE